MFMLDVFINGIVFVTILFLGFHLGRKYERFLCDGELRDAERLLTQRAADLPKAGETSTTSGSFGVNLNGVYDKSSASR